MNTFVSTPWRRKPKLRNKIPFLPIFFLFVMDFFFIRFYPAILFKFELGTLYRCKYFKKNSEFDPKIPKIERNYTLNLNFSEPSYSDECELCRFKVRNIPYSDSTSRDLLLLIGVDSVQNLLPLMRTLRTTNSKCTVVLFIDDKAVIDKSTRRAATKCGLHIFRCARFRTRSAFPCSRDNFVFFYIEAFLEQNAGKFERIIISDSYDIVFQGDPFNIQVTRNAITGYRSTAYKSRIGEFDESNIQAFEWPLYYICGIYYGGSEQQILDLTKIITSYLKLPSGTQDSTNFYDYFNTKTKEKFIIQSPITKTEFVYSPIKGILRGGKPNAEKSKLRKTLKSKAPLLGRIRTHMDPNSYASVIRKVSYSQYLMGSIMRSCPRTDPSQSNYLSYLDESRVIDIENKFIIDDLDN